MEYLYLNEKEIEKVDSMFALMNEICNSYKEQFIEKKMKRYELIAKTFNYAVETIHKMFYQTQTFRWIYVRKNLKVQFKFYDAKIYLTRLNNNRKNQIKTKTNKEQNKHKHIAAFY